MNAEKLFYKELSFLEKDYNFEFLIKSKGLDKKFIFKKNNFEIGFFTRISQFDNLDYLYFSINEREKVLNIDDEYYRLFKTKSKKNYFWQLGIIVKEQLKQNNIFNYYISNNRDHF